MATGTCLDKDDMLDRDSETNFCSYGYKGFYC